MLQTSHSCCRSIAAPLTLAAAPATAAVAACCRLPARRTSLPARRCWSSGPRCWRRWAAHPAAATAAGFVAAAVLVVVLFALLHLPHNPSAQHHCLAARSAAAGLGPLGTAAAPAPANGIPARLPALLSSGPPAVVQLTPPHAYQSQFDATDSMLCSVCFYTARVNNHLLLYGMNTTM